MAVLNAWQKIDRVQGGMPFGNGSDGAYSSATIPTLTKDSCSGTSTSTTLTTSGSTFANGDILLIHQTRGTGVGQWEVNKVASGGGSTSLTLQVALNYTYTDSGASQAQAIKIPQYTDVTVQSGTWTVPVWDGNVGGVAPFAIKGTLTVTGTISAVGSGFNGGPAVGPGQVPTSKQGEGESAAGGGDSTAANGAGSGGSYWSDDGVPAGGGGYKNAGANTSYSTGGSAWGSFDDLTDDCGFGGGGGSGNKGNHAFMSGKGGNGGGYILLFAKNITISGAITGTGQNGDPPQDDTTNGGGPGGGGAGGAILIACVTATLGTTLATATGGTGGTGHAGNGGTGSIGRIAIHHSGTVTGTTSPTFTNVTDATLIESLGGSFLLNMI